jgi:hypothetical protein
VPSCGRRITEYLNGSIHVVEPLFIYSRIICVGLALKRPGRGTRAPRGTPGYARNNERTKPRAIVPGRLYQLDHVRVRASARGHSGTTGDRVREPSPVRTERRAGRGHAPDRADSGRLREAASRACGDGVTPHCTYGGTARRARRDLLCAPCGLFDIPTASVVPPHGSTHAMTLRTARGARRARAARMLARRTAVMDAVLFADHRECAPRPILEIAWCV